jgi:hypothetical protein
MMTSSLLFGSVFVLRDPQVMAVCRFASRHNSISTTQKAPWRSTRPIVAPLRVISGDRGLLHDECSGDKVMIRWSHSQVIKRANRFDGRPA